MSNKTTIRHFHSSHNAPYLPPPPTKKYNKLLVVRLFQDLVTIIDKRLVVLFDIIGKLYE